MSLRRALVDLFLLFLEWERCLLIPKGHVEGDGHKLCLSLKCWLCDRV